ncbi:hypothetical protein KKA14_17885 [bacterium]|nr:hypothetical protein [bacterium]
MNPFSKLFSKTLDVLPGADTEISVDLALTFEDLCMNETRKLCFAGRPSVSAILAELRKTTRSSYFSKTALKNKWIVVLVNGENIGVVDIHRSYVDSEDSISILQPLCGG